jgi:hypothetical protein
MSGAWERPEAALGNPAARTSPSTALGIGTPFQAAPQPSEAPEQKARPSEPAASDPLTLTPLLDDTELAWFEAGERLSGHPGTERSR